MNTKIALVRPFYDTVLITPSFGIGYLSSYLKSYGFDTVIIDALKDNLKESDILRIMQINKIEVLGITCLSAFYKEVINLSLFVREHDKNIKIIIGGIHPTFLPYQTLLETKCDYVVCGEGEKALKQLLENNFDNSNIRGVYSLKELPTEKTPFVKAEPILELNDLPFPDWDQMRPDTYPVAPIGVFLKKHPVATVLATRGCPYSCKFCATPNFYNPKVRFRSAENVFDEVKLLVNKYHAKEIHFHDDNLTFNRQFVVDLCELMLKNNINIPWACPNGIRADKIDDDLVKLMKKTGFYSCGLGIESANMQILKNINKMEDLNTIKNGISLLRKYKIEVCGFFIFGLPGETKETIQETIQFALKSDLTRANFTVLSILPGCDLFKELEGKFVPYYAPNMFRKPTYIPDGLTAEEIVAAESTATKKFYLRLPILLNCMRYFKISYFRRLFKKLKEYHISFFK